MRTELELIAETYLEAKSQGFSGNAVADFIRNEFVDSIRQELGDTEGSLIIDSSAGKGRWADTPWLAFFDPIVTESAQSGYYVVILFGANMDRVVLSFNQGITELRNERLVRRIRG